MVHLGFGALHVLLLHIWKLGKCFVGLLLEVKRLAVVLELVVRMRNCLVAGDHLKVALAEEGDVAVQALQETVDGRLEVLEVLIHETKVQVQRGDVWVILAC